MNGPGNVLHIEDVICGERFVIKEYLGEGILIEWGNDSYEMNYTDFFSFATELMDDTIYKVKTKKPTLKYREKMHDKAYHFLENDMVGMLKNRKKIVLKGSGRHSKELINLWNGKLEIYGVLTDDIKTDLGLLPLSESDLKEKDDIAVVLSSYVYRKEMRYELELMGIDIDIVDIYDEMDKKGIVLFDAFFNY